MNKITLNDIELLAGLVEMYWKDIENDPDFKVQIESCKRLGKFVDELYAKKSLAIRKQIFAKEHGIKVSQVRIAK